MAVPNKSKSRWRTGLRRGWCTVAVIFGIYLALVLGGWMNPSTPADYFMNLGSFSRRAELAVPADGRVRLVVLQHGLWRSAMSLAKLERALVAHGYVVFNESFPSTTRRIEEHADRLAERLQQEFPNPVDEVFFVGHSLGGLVLQAYLQRPGALHPTASVFIGTPHRGAVLADLRKEGLLFRLFMGVQSTLQLSPGHPFNLRPIDVPGAVGTIVGSGGNPDGFNEDIPGDDDGTVAVPEAHLDGEDDSVTLPIGHTRLSFDNGMIFQVLHFLQNRSFAR